MTLSNPIKILNGPIQLIPVLDTSALKKKGIASQLPCADISDQDLSIILDPLLRKKSGYAKAGKVIIPSIELGAYFLGGYRVSHNQAIIFEPQCCCDLKNIQDWKHLSTSTEKNWQTLWIGHPWAMSKVEGDAIFITSQLSEDAAMVKPKPHEVLYQLTRKELAKAVKQAEQIVYPFLDRVIVYLENKLI